MAKIEDEAPPPHSPRHCMDYLRALKVRPEGVLASKMSNMKEVKNRTNRDYLVDNGLCVYKTVNGVERFFITENGLAAEAKGDELK